MAKKSLSSAQVAVEVVSNLIRDLNVDLRLFHNYSSPSPDSEATKTLRENHNPFGALPDLQYSKLEKSALSIDPKVDFKNSSIDPRAVAKKFKFEDVHSAYESLSNLINHAYVGESLTVNLTVPKPDEGYAKFKLGDKLNNHFLENLSNVIGYNVKLSDDQVEGLLKGTSCEFVAKSDSLVETINYVNSHLKAKNEFVDELANTLSVLNKNAGYVRITPYVGEDSIRVDVTINDPILSNSKKGETVFELGAVSTLIDRYDPQLKGAYMPKENKLFL
jgi:hypothetical protein